MALKIGNTDISKVYQGTTEIQSVYQGSSLIYQSGLPAGIYMVKEVNGKWVDVKYEDWNTSDTCVAIHIYTQSLLDYNVPFYIRVFDFAETLVEGQWATSNVMFPNVPTVSSTDVDGAWATYYMVQDAASLGISSPIATSARSSFLRKGAYFYSGYIGSFHQMNAMLGTSEARTLISNMVTLAGYHPTSLSEIWTSTQSATGSRAVVYSPTYEEFVTSNKTNSFKVIPCFNIPMD